MNRQAQIVCAWCGPAMVAVWIVAFVLLARFIPPPSPAETADQITEMFRSHVTATRFGLVLVAGASALLVPFAAVIAVQMRRIEGRNAVLALTQFGQGTLLSLEFIVPTMIWQAASFRSDTASPEIIRTLDDLGWLFFVGVPSTLMAQIAVIGFSALIGDRRDPVFPRWYGYFSLWISILLAPAGIVVLFKHGPFAWNGLLTFWLAVVSFCIWLFVTFRVLVLAINREEVQPA